MDNNDFKASLLLFFQEGYTGKHLGWCTLKHCWYSVTRSGLWACLSFCTWFKVGQSQPSVDCVAAQILLGSFVIMSNHSYKLCQLLSWLKGWYVFWFFFMKLHSIWYSFLALSVAMACLTLYCYSKSSELHVRSTVPLCGERDPYISVEDLFLKIFSFIVLSICNTGTEVSIFEIV